jgi:hypothetical protein
MRTYAEYLKTLTVKALREIIAGMDMPTPRAKTLKADLIGQIEAGMGYVHAEALKMNTPTVHPAAAYMTEVVERNRRRLAGYVSQVGRDKYGRAKFTARQRRRAMKKAHHAQAVWERLSAQSV